MGKNYYKRINNRLSTNEKNEKYKTFVESSHKEFEETDFRKFTYLEVIGNTKEHDEYNTALMRKGQNLFLENIIFKAHTEPFEARNGKKLPWAFGALGIGLLTFFIFLLFPKFQVWKLKNFKSGKIEEDTELKEFLNYFIPRKGFYITPITINLNLLMYIIMIFSGLDLASFKGSDLLNWGASYKPLTTNGQWWRLLTNTFIHSGLIHILINMYGLLFIGIFLEPVLGKKKFIFVYLLAGISASITSLVLYNATISVGASGAIFGLYGCFLACMLLKVFPPKFRVAFIISTIVFVGYYLLIGFRGSKDNAAHISGLLCGFVLGIMMSEQLKQKEETTLENE
ncbi:MAG: rhomboid family intramembrane serine protease [Chitinophagaceae bacterium]|nr:MAG: rhomboid family intramembrane serine protease [Chitinophagaceae bacterium]